ncbi:cell division protein ZapA [Anaerococcus hydrogenalis]|uniref:cell division protein ZapA n=1 Tax=Anaerococcus hydrogenalis TaxID=33029 RepID=UPI0028FF94CD|nr:cell division protein ZapA [Anaerococcus hydrogenalis]MDU1316055.1 cell division protein ZapA [Anaerococcus hydrogenalis]MDU3153131.1 cell division protein ZapA [Anaerococcus hydrogenalis]MDU3199301.1 cell division protein ZapA [Anaerococcus hydrogenalis]
MADNKIVVNIAGMDYTLVSDQEKNEIEQIAAYVDKKIREIDNDKLTRENQLVLASVNIADEMYRILIKHKKLREKAKDPIENYPKIKEAYEKLEEENKITKDDFEKSKKDFMESMKKIDGLNSTINRLNAEIDNKNKINKAKDENLKKLRENLTKLQEENLDLQKENEDLKGNL